MHCMCAQAAPLIYEAVPARQVTKALAKVATLSAACRSYPMALAKVATLYLGGLL